ncbi:MAG: restriction endonuclease subunit S, partial [Lamprobacter sp.]|uniref:restriction endonuclease subunit S n=1 Tax=Lamprobacter sp. TaxID=3100796 RepID=UPI002B25F523
MSWRQASIEDACVMVTDGTHYTPPDVDSGVPFLTVKDFTHDGKIDLVGCSHISQDEFAKADKGNSAPKIGDVLFSKDGTVGKVYVVASKDRFAVLSSLAILRPDPSILDADYFGWVLKTDSCIDQASRSKTGSAIRRIILKDLKRVKFPLPPLAEQKQIAAILDAADALRAKRRESLAQLDRLLQSTFLELFGNPVTNPKGWEAKQLGELGTLDRGVSKHRPRNDPSLLGGSHPLIQTGEVANSGGYIANYTSTYSELGLKQSRMWPAGTLCITIAANIANTGILTFDACFPDSVVGFSSPIPGRIEYVQGLFWFFRDILERRAPQSAQKNINLKILRGLPVPVPPDNLQSRFATIVESIEHQKTRLRAHLAELDNLFAS